MVIKHVSKTNPPVPKVKKTIVLQKNHAIGLAGNILWLLLNKQQINNEQSIYLVELKQALKVNWHNSYNDFLYKLSLGYNLLNNADFSQSDKKSIPGWSFALQQKATGGINFSKDWKLESANTAFLSANYSDPRPSMGADQKILIANLENIQYKFSGYFATHRASACIKLISYDKEHRKIDENNINVQNSAKFGGGNTLDSYELIESIFVPAEKTQYLTLKIEMGEQIDKSIPNAYLFCAKLFFGINDPDQVFSEGFIHSPGINRLSQRLLDQTWETYGTVELPDKALKRQLSVKLLNQHHIVDLKEELPTINAVRESKLQGYKATQRLLQEENLSHLISIESINIEELLRLNQNYKFTSLYECIHCAIVQKQPHTIKLYSEPLENSQFYVYLGLEHEKKGMIDIAENCYKVALFFHPNPLAYEHLGNIVLNKNQNELAEFFYVNAISQKTQSFWVYVNLSHVYLKQGRFNKAIDIILDALTVFPEIKFLLDQLDKVANEIWNGNSELLNFYASINDRKQLLTNTEEIVNLIALSYKKAFVRNSDIQITKNTNFCHVLIIADTFLPQCIRYRVEQKIEQLQLAEIQTEYISWTEGAKAQQAIPFYNIIIFYRVPALPNIIKLIEYSRSIGKSTFYEIDDLIFDPIYPPHISSYGGSIDATQYNDLIKGMALYHSAAKLCDYALASTKPLMAKLSPLVISKKGFLHRNALDSNSIFELKKDQSQQYTTIFYGSGTLAHNSDFIDEVLPALEKVMNEFEYVRLVIVGYLQLPEKFRKIHKRQIILLPFTKNLQVYNSYLRAADINIAVLKTDLINDCKSELKWFEAACFGIPSIVSITQNYQDVIRHGKDGYIVHNDESWYETLKKLITDPELRNKIGHSAHLKVKKDYSLKAMSDNLLQIFSKIS